MNDKTQTPHVLMTIKQFSETHKAFSQNSLRHLLFQSHARTTSRGPIPGNGLEKSGAVLRLGRKILIDEARFFAWLRSRQGTGRG